LVINGTVAFSGTNSLLIPGATSRMDLPASWQIAGFTYSASKSGLGTPSKTAINLAELRVCGTFPSLGRYLPSRNRADDINFETQ
jgi:hypothetical protein